MKSLKIGDIKLKNPFILAPMVDVTDCAYREICRKAGASLAYTEMLYIDAILHENRKTMSLMKRYPKENPLGIQITGNNLEEFKRGINFIKDYDLVDINCGCPSERITGNKAGSYLLKSPEKIVSIIKMLKSTGLTVTAKIRLGFDKNNSLNVAKKIEKAGADALTVHARLAKEGYDTSADWTWISKIKKEIGIPVIGNGDINSGEKAREMLEIADGAMIARAAIGNPGIFKQILYYFKTGKERPPTSKERIQSLKEYIKLAKNYKIAEMPRIKQLGCHFIKGQEGAAKMRAELMGMKTLDEIERFV